MKDNRGVRRALSLSSAMALLLLMASGASADDQTIAGANCQVSLGSGGPDGNDGFRASGGSTVAICPLVKQVGTTPTSAWVRWRRSSANTFMNCTILAGHPQGTSTSTSWVQPPSGVGPGTLSLPIPANVQSSGYLSVMCVLAANDTIHGVRLIQN